MVPVELFGSWILCMCVHKAHKAIVTCSGCFVDVELKSALMNSFELQVDLGCNRVECLVVYSSCEVDDCERLSQSWLFPVEDFMNFCKLRTKQQQTHLMCDTSGFAHRDSVAFTKPISFEAGLSCYSVVPVENAISVQKTSRRKHRDARSWWNIIVSVCSILLGFYLKALIVWKIEWPEIVQLNWLTFHNFQVACGDMRINRFSWIITRSRPSLLDQWHFRSVNNRKLLIIGEQIIFACGINMNLWSFVAGQLVLFGISRAFICCNTENDWIRAPEMSTQKVVTLRLHLRHFEVLQEKKYGTEMLATISFEIAMENRFELRVLRVLYLTDFDLFPHF